MSQITSLQENVMFKHYETTLKSILYKPADSTPCPVVILVPGHGIRSNTIDAHGTFDFLLSIIGQSLINAGIAVFHYNRPGTGGSTGDWRYQTIYDRADEVIAAIRFMRDTSHVQPTYIGVLGHSNGGWVAPLVATVSDAVDFVVTVAGPGISLGAQVLSAFKISLSQQNISLMNQIKILSQAQTIITLYRHIIAGEQTQFHILRERLTQEVLHHPNLFDTFSLPIPTWAERDSILASMDSMIDYDALTPLQQVRCPILSIFGEHDAAFDSVESAALFAYAFRINGNPNTSIHILPAATHRMQIRGESGDMEIAPHFQDLVTAWIKQVITHNQ